MRKLDLIIENIRDEYMINLLEEGTASELESLKTKKFLNENLNRIRNMLIEEGAIDSVKNHLGNNWGKYLGAAGAAGLGYAANEHFGDPAGAAATSAIDPRDSTLSDDPVEAAKMAVANSNTGRELADAAGETDAVRQSVEATMPAFVAPHGGQAGIVDARAGLSNAMQGNIPGEGNAMVDKAVQYHDNIAGQQINPEELARVAAAQKDFSGGRW